MSLDGDSNTSQRLVISEEQQATRKEYLRFAKAEADALKSLYGLVEEHVDSIVDKFYAHLENYAEAMKVLDNSNSSMERLKQAQRRYLLELFSGDYDNAYFTKRCMIGERHVAIDLQPIWYIGGYSVFMEELVPLILKKYRFSPAKMQQALTALNKVLLLDIQLTMDTYIHGVTSEIHRSKAAIEKKVDDYSVVIKKVSEGELQHRIEVEGDDALAHLGNRFNTMVESLASMAAQTQHSSDDILGMLQDVHQAITSQSSGASQQAASINETTTTLSEIRATSNQTLEKAERLDQISKQTRKESEEGVAAVNRSILGMERIKNNVSGIAQTILALSQQTQQISEITDVVTGLAQQLKMLALNASIEAAKAGESGRGFGVVASEVKALAEQSQQSTAQVQRILLDIKHATDRAVMATEEGEKGVDDGVELVRQAERSMHGLMEIVRETSMASQQIMAAVGQEVAGIDQVATAMNEINEVTHQFVESSAKTKNAADELRDLSDKLAEGVQAYKL